ncbi:unnamed protein product [Cylindrotheca closterium]|nr:unnamed protein product [Cylindrotheca closterium]
MDVSEKDDNTTTAVSPESILYARARNRLLDAVAKRLVETVEPKTDPLVEQVRDQLPKEAEDVRKLPFYNSTLQSLQYQRDQYFMGTKYAADKQAAQQEQRQQQLQRRSESYDDDGENSLPFRRNKPPPNPLKAHYDPTSLASQQTIPLGASFLPSPLVHNALLPIVVGLPNGALREPILNATVNSIPMAQPALNDVVKNTMIQFLSNPHWKEVVQNQTNKTLIGSNRG